MKCASSIARTCRFILLSLTLFSFTSLNSHELQAETENLDALLNKLEDKANTIRSMSANVRWEKVNELRGDTQKRYGDLIYLVGPPAKFAVNFKTLLIEAGEDRPQKIDQNRAYIFDGVWLVEKITDKKQFIKRQIAPEPTEEKEGDEENLETEEKKEMPKPDPLAEGKGPFAVPLKFNKKQLMERFTISLVTNAEDEKLRITSSSYHLKFTPRPPRQVDFKEMHIWYDTSTLFPKRVSTIEKAGTSNFDLYRVKINSQMKTSLLNLITTDPPKEDGWQVEIEKLK